MHQTGICLQRCHERRSSGGVDGHCDAERRQQIARCLWIWMFTTELDKPRASDGRRRRVRTCAPINEKGYQPIGEHRARVSELPRENDAIGSLTTTMVHAAELNAASCCVDHELRKICRGGRPRHQTRSGQRVDLEPSRRAERRLLGIRSDDLEIAGRANRNQCVPSAAPPMLAPDGSAHAQQAFELGASVVEVRRSINEVINSVCQNARRHVDLVAGAPT